MRDTSVLLDGVTGRYKRSVRVLDRFTGVDSPLYAVRAKKNYPSVYVRTCIQLVNKDRLVLWLTELGVVRRAVQAFLFRHTIRFGVFLTQTTTTTTVYN